MNKYSDYDLKDSKNQDHQEQLNNNSGAKFWKIISIAVIVFIFISMIGWSFFQSIFGQEEGFVAKVGNKVISEKELSQYIENIESQISNAGLSQITQKHLYKFAIDELIENKMIEQEIERFGIHFSDKDTLKHVINNTDVNGKTKVKEQLESLSKNNPALFRSILDFYKRRLFLNSIDPAMAGGSFGSSKALEYIAKFRFEERTYTILHTDSGSLGKIKEPNNADLVSIYENNISKFTLSSSKNVLFFNVADVKMETLPDSKIIDYYKNQMGKQINSTVRDIDLLLFNKSEEAEKALFMLQNGNSNITQIVKSIPSMRVSRLKAIKSTDLKTEIASQVFSVGLGKPTQVLSSDGNFVIGITRQIKDSNPSLHLNSGNIKSIRNAVEKAMRCDMSTEVKDKVMEMVSSGYKFSDVAEKFKISLKKATVTNGKVNSILGKQVSNDIDTGVEGFVGMDNNNLKCDTVFYLIESVNPPKKIPFEEVRKKVINIWKSTIIDGEIATHHMYMMSAISNDNIVKPAISVQKIAKSFKSHFIPNNTANRKTIQRQSIVQDDSFPKKLFEARVGEVIGPFKHTDNGMVSIVLNNIHKGNSSSSTASYNKLKNDVIEQRKKDYHEAYRQYLKNKYKVVVYKRYTVYLEQ
ncbi:MAG: SurA N-terminal domain-containing protein [Alphaproteobacteria bacterium]|nr:SurA N-terminal domain-containing protein [Rickettsiales bacterium]